MILAVLLFLLGSNIYFKNKTFSERINDEIRDTCKNFGAKIPKNKQEFEKEFLFRWKLISTFLYPAKLL